MTDVTTFGKRALVLGGGAAKGAFQAGVVYNLIQRGYKWDKVYGVSVGAINGSCIAMFKSSDVQLAGEQLIKNWTINLSQEHVYKKWIRFDWLNYPIAFFKNGLYDTAPLKNFLNQQVNLEGIKESDVYFEFYATSFTNGTVKKINKFDNNLIDWILASASFPMAFPPVKMGEEYYMDGALKTAVPIKEALEAGAKHLDVVITDPFGGHIKLNKKPDNVLDIFVRTAEILSDEVFLADLRQCSHQYQATIDIYAPFMHLTNNSLDFSKEQIKQMLTLGLNCQTMYRIDASCI